jgi:hypothetical protein
MEMMRRHAGRLRSGAGALVVTVAVAAAVTGGYFGLRHAGLAGDAAGGPAARYGAAMTYDPATGDVVLFGGTGASGQTLDDTWLWDGSTWSQAAPADSPPARYGAQMAWDPQSQRVILLGGSGGSGCSTGIGTGTLISSTAGCAQLQDVWAWDGSDWSRLALGQGTGQLGRYTLAGASMATDATSGRIVLVTADSPADIPAPAPITNSSGAPVVAPPVSSAVAVTGTAGVTGSGGAAGSAGGTCIGVDGGSCGSPVALPTASSSTAPLPTACPLDGGCTSSVCPALAPGSGASPSYAIACCSSTALACPICPVEVSPAAGTANPVTSICGICPVAQGTSSAQAGTAVVCSNCPLETCSASVVPATLTWVFDGSRFQPVTVSASDAPASGGALAWFPGPGLLVDLGADVAFADGGSTVACPADAPCPLIPAAEDGTWTGSGWNALQDLPAGAAAPFLEVAPVADPAAGDVVGVDQAGGTWVSTDPKAGWTEASPESSPAARSDFALAFDGATGQVVLFGGQLQGDTSTAGTVAGDTWTWNGSDWALRAGGVPSPSAAPSGWATPVASPVMVPGSAPATPPQTIAPLAPTTAATPAGSVSPTATPST